MAVSAGGKRPCSIVAFFHLLHLQPRYRRAIITLYIWDQLVSQSGSACPQTHTHTLVTLTAKMVDDDVLSYKVKVHLRGVLDNYWGSEKSAYLKSPDGWISTWKALAEDVKVELFKALLDDWQHSRNTVLVSEASNDEETTQKIKGLIGEDYTRWRNNQSAQKRSKKCTSALSCPTESRTNDPPAKSSSAFAESGTAEPGPEGA